MRTPHPAPRDTGEAPATTEDELSAPSSTAQVARPPAPESTAAHLESSAPPAAATADSGGTPAPSGTATALLPESDAPSIDAPAVLPEGDAPSVDAPEPDSDELSTFYNDGRFNYFEGGTIYWKSGKSAAYEVHGCHGDVYGRMGWEWSALGYPTTDELTVDNRKVSRFEAGNLYTRTGASGSNCADLSWPVLTKDNGNAYNKVRVRGKGFITATLSNDSDYGAHLTVKGENFKPGESLTFLVTHPASQVRVSMPNKYADANGKFNISQENSSLNWHIKAADLRSVNGWVTVVVYGDQGSYALTQSYTTAAIPYVGSM